MDDISVIDRFLDIFSTYIDSGFGLLSGEVAFLTATLIVVDMTIAALYWALSNATGQGDDVFARLIRKVLYIGAFAYIIGNFNWLAGIVFRSFAGLGLMATGTTSIESLLQPGRLAKAGIDAGAPLLEQINEMAGFPEVLVNLVPIGVLSLAWLVLILAFFTLSVQLFVTLIEFKIVTLAGFVLVPFALWQKTSFLAEKVLGNVMSSGVKVLVLAVIIGIGTTIFAEFQTAPPEPDIDHALVLILASLTLFALGIFGPGIASGLISGGPQLGAGAMAGAAVGAAGTAAAVGAAATGVGTAAAAGARMASSAGRSAPNAAHAYRFTSKAAGGGLRGMSAGIRGMARSMGAAPGANAAQSSAAKAPPAWASRLQQGHQAGRATAVVARTLRSGDAPASSNGPNLKDT